MRITTKSNAIYDFQMGEVVKKNGSPLDNYYVHGSTDPQNLRATSPRIYDENLIKKLPGEFLVGDRLILEEIIDENTTGKISITSAIVKIEADILN